MSESCHLLELLGITSSLDRDILCRALNLRQILRRELNGCRSDVLFEAREFRCARDGSNPRLLCKKPRQSDLGRRRLFPRRHRAQEIHHSLIRLQSLRREAGQLTAEIRAVELCVFADLSREEALA